MTPEEIVNKLFADHDDPDVPLMYQNKRTEVGERGLCRVLIESALEELKNPIANSDKAPILYLDAWCWVFCDTQKAEFAFKKGYYTFEYCCMVCDLSVSYIRTSLRKLLEKLGRKAVITSLLQKHIDRLPARCRPNIIQELNEHYGGGLWLTDLPQRPTTRPAQRQLAS